MKAGTFVTAFILITAGLVMLLDNMGYDPWIYAGEIYRYWPVIIILIGISFFWGGMIPRWLGILLILTVAGAISVFAFQGSGSTRVPDLPFELGTSKTPNLCVTLPTQNAHLLHCSVVSD